MTKGQSVVRRFPTEFNLSKHNSKLCLQKELFSRAAAEACLVSLNNIPYAIPFLKRKSVLKMGYQ